MLVFAQLINHETTHDSVMKRHLRLWCPPFKKAGGNTPSFHRSPASLELPMMLLCKGICAHAAAPFKGQGGSAPVMHSRSGVPEQVYKNTYTVLLNIWWEINYIINHTTYTSFQIETHFINLLWFLFILCELIEIKYFKKRYNAVVGFTEAIAI